MIRIVPIPETDMFGVFSTVKDTFLEFDGQMAWHHPSDIAFSTTTLTECDLMEHICMLWSSNQAQEDTP